MAYRDDREALEGHKTELEAKLTALRAQLAENKALEATTLETVRELEETYVKLRIAKAKTGEGAQRRALPLLERVYIAAPCAVPWESMTGDERARVCASCDKTVYDLSAMTRDEAEALLKSKGTDACLRIFRRFDGTVLTADCPVGVAKKKRARRRGAVAGVLAAAAAAAGFAWSTRERSESPLAGTTGTTSTHVENSSGDDGAQLPPGVPSIHDERGAVSSGGGVVAIAPDPAPPPRRAPRARRGR